MIQKSAVTGLTKSLAQQRFDEAKQVEGTVVEMIEQDDGKWTVTIVFDDEGTEVSFGDLTAFDEVRGKVPEIAALAAAAMEGLGSLSQRFESNGKSGAIGFDKAGGFSYGAYQIASRTGTMVKFLEFLASGFPALSAPLASAGGSAAASAGADAFRSAWQALAANPEFLKAQHAFIAATHYEPFARALLLPPLNLDISARSPILRDVAWSVSVQHGAANKIFRNALAGKSVASMTDRQIIQSVYDERSDVLKYFPSSTAKIQQSLKNRFKDELQLALSKAPSP